MRACKLPALTGNLYRHDALSGSNPRSSEAPLQSLNFRPSSRALALQCVPARLVGLLVAAFTVFMAMTASSRPTLAADPPAGKPIGIYLEGIEPEVVRSAILAALADRFPVVDSAALSQALTREGLRLPVGAPLTRQKGNTSIPKIRNAATAVDAEAVLAGRTIKIGASMIATLIWIDPKSPEPKLVKEVALTTDAASNKEAMIAAIGTQLDAYAAAGAPAPKAPVAVGPAVVSGPTVAPPPPLPPGGRQRGQVNTAIVVANVAFEIGGRRFDYKDALSPNTSSYGVFGVPVPSVGIEVYPAAGTTIPIVRDLGLTMRFAHAFGISSVTDDGTSVSTGWTRIGGGLRARFHPGSPTGPMIGVSGGIDYLQFNFDASGAITDSLPAVTYASLRAGIDGRIPFWKMALLLDVGYDGPLSAGPVYDRFRDSSVGGVDLGVGLALVLGSGFELRMRGHYTRYFYKFHPVLGDAYVAGGALDEFLGVGLGVAYAY